MNLIMFMPSFRGGGAEKVFVNLANNFASRGDTVYLCVSQSTGPNKDLVHKSVSIIDLNSKSVLLSFFKLKRFIISKSGEGNVVLFTNTLSCNLVGSLIKIFTKNITLVLREANVLPSTITIKQRIRNYLSFSLYHKADSIITNSPDTYRDVSRMNHKINQKKLFVIGNPIIEKSNSSKIPFSKKKHDSIRLISVGRLSEQKNYDLSVLIIKMLRDKGVDARLDIYGEGNKQNQIASLISSYQLSDFIKLKGYAQNINEVYSRYDIFLLTSLWEGFGNVIVEALSYGLPCVISNCSGGPKFIINSNELGYLCELEAEQFCDAILEATRSNSSSKQRKRIMRANDFSVMSISEEYYKVISTAHL